MARNVKLTVVRKLNNLSQTQMAGRVHITQQGYGRYELGTAQLDCARACEFARVLNVDKNFLLSDEDFDLLVAYNEKGEIKITLVPRQKANAAETEMNVWMQNKMTGLEEMMCLVLQGMKEMKKSSRRTRTLHKRKSAKKAKR